MSLKCNFLIILALVFVRHIRDIRLNFFINNFVASLYKSKPETIKKHIDFFYKKQIKPEVCRFIE